MKQVSLRSHKLKFDPEFHVIRKLFEEIEGRIFSWGLGYHDVWMALYDAIEEMESDE